MDSSNLASPQSASVPLPLDLQLLQPFPLAVSRQLALLSPPFHSLSSPYPFVVVSPPVCLSPISPFSHLLSAFFLICHITATSALPVAITFSGHSRPSQIFVLYLHCSEPVLVLESIDRSPASPSDSLPAQAHFVPARQSTALMQEEQPHSVLITGGCGFIGSNFINYIYDHWKQTKIVNFDKLDFGAKQSHVDKRVRDSNRYVFVEANLEDQPTLDQCFRQHQVDMVIHFAAITHVDESYRHRIDTIKDNIISTATLLESIVNRNYTGVKRFVHISTDEVYGDSHEDDLPKTEASAFNPTNPYAASKASCELIIRAYCVCVALHRISFMILIAAFLQIALRNGSYEQCLRSSAGRHQTYPKVYEIGSRRETLPFDGRWTPYEVIAYF
ncbi:hypothetical protein WR25_09504 isoform B [Diploscapter pachys]|uniref:dTDP-D-glucose 4,6-dehydratase n=1 Tax=Diploscapter pachys TaxID=2018661 RepID=A0A2A2J3I6_9BILA|nr:hypothetical protein WR25_09504 isoform B [Diploscapter pachys]